MSVFLQLAQWSALHSAARDDDIASVEQFIKMKENINAPAAPVSVKIYFHNHLVFDCQDAVTPLFVACSQGHVQVVQRLISVKANVNCVTKVSHDAMGLDSIRCFVLIYKKIYNF